MRDPKKLLACALSLLLVAGVGFPVMAFGDKAPDAVTEFVGLVGDPALPAEDAVAPEPAPAEGDDPASEAGEGLDSAVGEKAADSEVPETSPSSVETAAAESLVSFVYVDRQTISQPETQHVAISLLEEAPGLSQAVLTLENDGERRAVSASAATESSVLFSFSTEGWTSGEWVAKSIAYRGEDGEVSLDLSACDIARFLIVPSSEAGIAVASAEAPDADDVSFFTVDESGEVVEASSMEDALEQSAQAAAPSKNARTMSRSRAAAPDGQSRAGELVVAIDPGHGGTESGASGVSGSREEVLTWKIANYCKAELEAYQGVRVILTKTENETVSIYNRVKRAVDQGADVVVSIHLNSSDLPHANGAEVWVPNSSDYNHDTHVVGTALGSKILDELEKLGLNDRGVKTRVDGTDLSGHPIDYYGITRYARQYGIPGIIVEHAFISSPLDYELYLSDESKLRKLGVADATGIARQYGLSKQVTTLPTGTLKVVAADQAAGSITYEAQVSSSTGVSAVQLPVWCETVGGQDDLRWYTMSPKSVDSRGNGTYRLTVSTANHGKQAGDYQAHLYVVSGAGVQTYLTSVVQRMTPVSNAAVTATLSSDRRSVVLTAKGGKLASAVSVSFPTWSLEGGQDDIVWYPGQRNALDGSWSVTVPLSNHGSAGEYAAHCYMTAGGSQSFVGSASFTHQAATGTVKVVSTDQSAGTMVIQATVSSPVGVGSVQLPVWCSSVGGQDDIRWYAMSPTSVDSLGRGTYRITVNMANHAYQSGDYAAHLYVTDKIGARAYVDSTSQRLTLPPATVVAKSSSDGLSYTITAKGGRLASAASVSIPVWSLNGGQDDIVWYPATKNSLTGEWSVKVSVPRHGDTGKYAAHCYMMLGGSQVFVGETSFTVSRPTGSVKVVSADQSAGTMVIEASVSSSLGIRSIQLPVWCTTVGGQDDIRWYSMAPYSVDSKGNGSYRVTVRISDHGYQQGDYAIHAYATDRAGIQSFVTETTYRLMPTPVSVSAQKSSDGLSYTITAKGGNLPRATSVEFPTWSLAGGQDDIVWYLGAKNSLTGTWTAQVPISNHRTAGTYASHCYLTLGGVRSYAGETSFSVSQTIVDGLNYRIMGSSNASVTQMVRMWNAKGKTYPTMVYTAKGADNIEKFCSILCEEAKAEGVKPEVLFAQVMLETGWLQFQGSSVKADQCNFGGIGATDSNPRPATFPDVRTGLRAQTQHLKAYASTDALRNPCVDPRFNLVKRGSATTVIALSGKWASDPAYGTKLLTLIEELSKY